MALSGALVAAVRTGITARLADRPATAAEVAADLGLDPVATRLLLDFLRSIGHVTQRRGRYRLARAARRWLDPASPVSVAGYIAGATDYWPWWQNLDQVVRTGVEEGSHGADPADPYWRRYITGQLELASLSAAEVASKLPLPRRPRAVLDVGGGHGWYSAQLCRRHPGLTATVLDLPGSAAIGREIIAAAGLSDRVRFRDGDATTADFGGGYDAVLCFNLVHHLDPGQIAGLFKRAHAALKPGGTIAVLDAFAEPGRRASVQHDALALFVYLSSGSQVRTPGELDGWLRGAGFSPPRSVRILRVPGLSLRVARKLPIIANGPVLHCSPRAGRRTRRPPLATRPRPPRA